MASKMVERVAISIWNKMTFGTNSAHWAAQPEMITNHYREVAKAAIEAMREPTEEMIRESTECCGDHVAAYQAMINKAL